MPSFLSAKIHLPIRLDPKPAHPSSSSEVKVFLHSLLIAVLAASLAAQEASEMRTEVFVAPENFLYQDPDLKPPEVWPMMPYPFDFPGKTAGQLLSIHGIDFGEGAYALHDPWRHTLTVHNTEAQLQKVAGLLEKFEQDQINEVVRIYHFIELPKSDLNRLTGKDPDHATLIVDRVALLRDSAQPGTQIRILATLISNSTTSDDGRVSSGTTLGFNTQSDQDKHQGRISHDETFAGFEADATLRFDPNENCFEIEATMKFAPAFNLKANPRMLKKHLRLAPGQCALLDQWPALPVKTGSDLVQAALIYLHPCRPAAPESQEHHRRELVERPDDWVEHAFAVPPDITTIYPTTILSPYVRHGELPPQPEFKTQTLLAYGIELPEGSQVTFDPAGFLRVRTRRDHLDRIDAWSRALSWRTLQTTRCTLEVFRVKAFDFLSALHQEAKHTSHARLHQKVEKAASEEKARLVEFAHHETSPSWRENSSFTWHHFLNDMRLSEKGLASLYTHLRQYGLFVKMDGYIDNPGGSYETTIEFTRGQPTWNADFLDIIAEPGQLPLRLPRSRYVECISRSSVRLPDGKPVLVAAWTPTDATGTLQSESLDLAFVTNRIVRMKPSPLWDSSPEPLKEISCRLHLFEADSTLVHDWVRRSLDETDHRGALNALNAYAQSGNAVLIAKLSGTCSPGERGRFEDKSARSILSSIDFTEDPNGVTGRDEMEIGASLDIELGQDSIPQLARLYYHLDWSVVAGEERKFSLPAPNAPNLQAALQNFRCETIRGGVAMQPGTARILSAWKSNSAAENEAPPRWLIAIFELDPISAP